MNKDSFLEHAGLLALTCGEQTLVILHLLPIFKTHHLFLGIYLGGLVGGWRNGWVEGLVSERMDRWRNEQVEGWMGGGMDGWRDE